MEPMAYEENRNGQSKQDENILKQRYFHRVFLEIWFQLKYLTKILGVVISEDLNLCVKVFKSV